MLQRRHLLLSSLFATYSLSGCGGSADAASAVAGSEGPLGAAPPNPAPTPSPPAPTPPTPTPPVPSPAPSPTPSPPSPAPAPPSPPPTAPPPPPAVYDRGNLPAWVPLTQGEAALVPMQNRLQDVAFLDEPRLGNNSTFVFAAYSGGAYNPYYGAWGAHVIHGGGHAATQDNSVFIADFNTLRFERIGGPTMLSSFQAYEDAIRSGGFPDDESNPREVAPSVPGSAHTYDCLLILPPEVAGDPYGALIRPVAGAIGVGVSRSTGWSHAFTFGDRRWQRFSTNHARSWPPGGSCAYDTQRQRIWPIAADNVPWLMSLDVRSRAWTNSGGGPQSIAAYPDMVYSAYCAHRDVIAIAAHRESATEANFYWFSAAGSGFERTRVRFTNGPLPPANWGRGSLVYVPDIARLIWFTLQGGDYYYEIDVPSNPANDWTWIARPITGAARPSILSPKPYSSVYKRLDYAPQLKSLVWVTAQDTSASYSFGGRVVAIRVAP